MIWASRARKLQALSPISFVSHTKAFSVSVSTLVGSRSEAPEGAGGTEQGLGRKWLRARHPEPAFPSQGHAAATHGVTHGVTCGVTRGVSRGVTHGVTSGVTRREREGHRSQRPQE